jgi:hypothetical protein
MFKSMREVQKQARRIEQTFDSGAMLDGAMGRMRSANDTLVQMTRAADLATSGLDASAIVTAVSQTGTMVNYQPTLKIELTVLRDGVPPYPVSVSEVVPQLYLAKASQGQSVPVRIDPASPDAVWIDWAAA